MTYRAMMYDEGAFSSRPAASVGDGYVWFATDTGDLYRSNGSAWTLISGTGGGGGAWTTVAQGTDQNVTDSTTTVDSDLLVPVVSGSVYMIRGEVFMDTTAAGDIKFGWASPGASTIRHLRTLAPSGTSINIPAVDTSLPTAQTLLSTTGPGAYYAFTILYVCNSSGDLIFKFAQQTQTADAGVTVFAGSYLEYMTL